VPKHRPRSGCKLGSNVPVSHRQLSLPPLYPLRLYVASERKYYNFDRAVDLGLVHAQAEALAEAMVSSGLVPDASAGGLMIRLAGTD